VDAIEAVGRRVVASELDVRDGEGVEAFVATVAAELGPVDVLVNNAGGGFYAGFLDVNDKGQDSLIRENFTSVTNFVRSTVPRMPEQGGSIVNITSIEAHRAAPGFAVYSAMKAAVASLTKSLALELGTRMVRVNCIAPDVIPTPGIGLEHGVHTPLPVAGHVDDVAGAALYLAGDLSRFVTGTTIHVDGGNWASGGWVRTTDGTFTLHPGAGDIPPAQLRARE
jgi:3-oxoacyl-[acyl-carrier protein] reductase